MTRKKLEWVYFSKRKRLMGATSYLVYIVLSIILAGVIAFLVILEQAIEQEWIFHEIWGWVDPDILQVGIVTCGIGFAFCIFLVVRNSVNIYLSLAITGIFFIIVTLVIQHYWLSMDGIWEIVLYYLMIASGVIAVLLVIALIGAIIDHYRD